MKFMFVAAIAAAVIISVNTTSAQGGYDLYQKALAAERGDGDLRTAIQLYERVVAQFATDRPLIARALLRIADCHEQLGQRDAAGVYQRIVRDFADQADSAAVARARLSALQGQAPPAAQAARKIWSGGDADATGTASADGRFLSYTNWLTGDLAIRDVAAGSARMLTNTGGWEASGDFAELSVLSPDASEVAYAWFIDKGGDPAAGCACRYELRVMPTTGARGVKPRVLIGGTSRSWVAPAAWMPDGRGLIFVRSAAPGTNEVALLTFGNSAVRVLKTVGAQPPRRIAVSPDGQFVAIDIEASADSPSRDITLVSVSDERETIVVQHPAHDYSPMFTSDGAHLLFLSNRTGTESLWRLPIASGRAAGNPSLVAAVAGNGNALLLGTGAGGAAYYWSGGPSTNIYAADLDDHASARGLPRLAIERFTNANSVPAFSPDGRFLAYQSRRGATHAGSSGGVIAIHSLETNQDRDVPALANAESVSWFPDSRSLLVAVRPQRQSRFDYYRVDAVTGQQHLLTSTQAPGLPGRRPQVSPDGLAVYFLDRILKDPLQSVVARFEVNTGMTTQVATVTGNHAFTSFAISPDGGQIATIRYDGSARRLVVDVLPIAGGAAREIFSENATGPTAYSGLAWSRDQRHVLFVRENALGRTGGLPGGSIWKIPLSGGPAQPTGIAMPGMVRHLAMNPGGTRVAFAVAGGDDPAVWSIENFLPRK
ncbi:MAG TPA: tetratricopeptide repeat protein [Vicinamibacterales bacterium]|nr:tetratricopeptide repeat protein [Vicinamibacterales bacterium]